MSYKVRVRVEAFKNGKYGGTEVVSAMDVSRDGLDPEQVEEHMRALLNQVQLDVIARLPAQLAHHETKTS